MRIPFTKYAIKRFNPRLEQQYAQCAVANDAMAHRSHARFHIINALLKHTHQPRTSGMVQAGKPISDFGRRATSGASWWMWTGVSESL
ncbi:MAG: hypothetical protein NTX48_05610 [Planctomycetales bacterium]|nr:hypothetical protein [Planctomycetales bacterium]